MVQINEQFLKLPGSYLFSEIARRVADFGGEDIIRMGIGDVTRPLAPEVIGALHEGVEELARAESFKGYGPEQGYAFLRELVVRHDYASRGVSLSPDEIFISDGAKSDTGNIGDIFAQNNRVAVCDPVYPVYVDVNVMAGRAGDYGPGQKWTKLAYMPCVPENGFVPDFPEGGADLIYLCYPNNPTGAAITGEQLRKWVDYANEKGAVILYDAAYEAFITEDLPHSIFEIDGAKTCAIEFRSFSKTAGFTGVRCGYTVVPRELKRGGASLNDLWNRRQCTKFNGASYLAQKAAAAVYTREGQKQVKAAVRGYLDNAKIISDGLQAAGFSASGGVNAPYIWLRVPAGMTSWDFFDDLLQKCRVVGTPGSGFGPSGEGFFRLTAFGAREDTLAAMERIRKAYGGGGSVSTK